MILMISIKTLKEEYFIDDNIEDKYLLSNIKKAQDFIIKPLLGITKTEELLSQINSGVVSSENDVLIKTYIQPVIAYFVISEVVYSTAYKLKNEGISEGDQYKFNELIKVSSKYLRDSQAYEQILRDYIYREGIILPILANEEVKASGYEIGIYLG